MHIQMSIVKYLKVAEINSTGMTEQLLFSSQGVKTGFKICFSGC